MAKERYFLITDSNSTDKLNDFLGELENSEVEYETDYDTDCKNGVLVIVSYED